MWTATIASRFRDVAKSFTMHLRDGVVLPVVANVSFDVAAGECVVLGGPSGIGKSSILKMVYGNYGVDSGAILLRRDDAMVDLATANPRETLELRRTVIGYVSQFLRTVPRVSALDVVAEPLAGSRCVPARGCPHPRRRASRPPQPARAAVVAAPRHLLRWRAAAGQHRPRLHYRSSGTAAR